MADTDIKTMMFMMGALLKAGNRGEALEAFASTLTFSAMQRNTTKRSAKDSVIFIVTEDTQDARGISHKVSEVSVESAKRSLAFADTVYKTNLVQTLEEQIAAAKTNNCFVVVNYLKNVDILTESRFNTQNNKYWLITLWK